MANTVKYEPKATAITIDDKSLTPYKKKTTKKAAKKSGKKK